VLNAHCLELMRDAPTGSAWFEPPAIFREQADTPWHDRKSPGDPAHDDALRQQVLDRILAVLLGRTFFVVDYEVCAPGALNWLTRNALGFQQGLLDLAASLGMERVHEICAAYAADNPGFEIPPSVAAKKMPDFYRNLVVERDGDISVIMICRPEVMNALNEQTLEELKTEIARTATDDTVAGVVLTSFGGALAGADIMELAALKTPAEAEQKCFHGQAILAQIAALNKPVVAAVDGPVLGGGAELSMACHARIVGPGLLLGQPEVNLGIIPGYGGTQRLPRLVGIEQGCRMLRSGAPIKAAAACAAGWASGDPTADYVAAAKQLIRDHVAGRVVIAPVKPEPIVLPDELPDVDIGHRSLVIDAILVGVIRDGLRKPLAEGLKVEAAGFARCKETIDYNIGMTNFIQNGPRVPAAFMNE
jgi:enoyl-CoA hydratase/carnithine racemase